MNLYKIVLILLMAVSLFIDYFTKWMVVSHMELHESIELIPGLLNLTYIRNMGVAFGMFSEYNAAIILSLVSGVAICFLGYLFYQTDNNRKLELFGIALIISGAAGNLIDRVQMQGVVDFIDVYWNESHWPAFNIADSAITVGMVFFLYTILFDKEEPTGGKSGEIPNS